MEDLLTQRYPEDPDADLVIVDDRSWCLLDETIELASNTFYFSFVVNMDGIAPPTGTSTRPATLSLFARGTIAYQEERQYLEDEVFLASLARTSKVPEKDKRARVCRVNGDPVYRVVSVGQSSAKSKSRNRNNKEVTQHEQRQYR